MPKNFGGFILIDLVIVPSNFFGGHEKMGVLLCNSLDIENALLYDRTNSFNLKNSLNISTFNLYIWLFLNSFKNKKIILIAGSPYGYLCMRIFLYILNFRIIEYTPFPELTVMIERFHHHLLPHINRHVVWRRILIADWQLRFSSVPISRCFVVENYIE